MLFNASERKGVLVLLFLIACLIVVPRQLLHRDHHLFLLPEMVVVEGDSFVFSRDTGKRIVPYSGFKVKQTRHVGTVELNTADSVALVRIRGIGPYYAGKILRYRERLGGFYSVKQLKELKMTYFDVDSCASLFSVDTTRIMKQDLDTMSFKAILKHPYLEYEDVQLILNAKRRYGTLSCSLLEEKKVLPAYKLKKVRPYFR